MRFQIRDPGGAEHDVELQGTIAVVGRDPSCDVVLNDPKCSRRHAVLEAGPEGIAIRDAGSANGIFVNGKKVERANLVDGDIIRMGEVQITMLAEDVPGTLVMGPEDMPDVSTASPPPPKPAAASPRPAATIPPPAAPAPAPPAFHATTPPTAAGPRVAPRPAPRPAPPVAAPAPTRRPPADRPRVAPRAAELGSAGPIPRPLTVTVIAALWMLSFFLYGVGGLAAVPLLHLQGTAMAVTLLSAIVLALLSALMAVGLWSRSPWARILQLVLAVQGLCGPFFVASAAILIYMLRDDVKIHFSGRQDFRDLSPQEAETARRTGSEGIFTGAVLGGVFLGVVALGIVAALVVPGIAGKQAMAQAASEAAVVAQVRSVLAGEEAFRMATCGTGYADLDSLIHPAAVIPNYSANSGSAFLAPEMAQSERFGYRFELRAEELVPPVEGCPTKSFRRFRYLAMPISGKGHGYLGVPEGTIHVAEGRAPTPDDPLLN